MEAFDLYSPEIDADPFPRYEILREQYPCYWSESGKLWILSPYHDILKAAQDWETFSSAQGNMVDELPGRAGATLGTTDPPRHDRLRALSQAAFTRKSAEQLIAPTLEIARPHRRERQIRVHQRLFQPDHGGTAISHHGIACAPPR
jgi:cytochrome P450